MNSCECWIFASLDCFCIWNLCWFWIWYLDDSWFDVSDWIWDWLNDCQFDVMKNWIFVNDMIFCWIFWCVDWNFWRFVWYFSFFNRHFGSILNESNESLMFRLYCVCFEFQSIWDDEFRFFSNRMFRASKRV